MIKELACKKITEVRSDEDDYFEDDKESPKKYKDFFVGVISIYTNHATYMLYYFLFDTSLSV